MKQPLRLRVAASMTFAVLGADVAGAGVPAASMPSSGVDAPSSTSTGTHWLRRHRASEFAAPAAGWLDAFSRALQDPSRTDPSEWRALGFEPRRSAGILWLREALPASGRGAYAIRLEAGIPLALQAPHGDTDLGTGTLALRLFEEFPIAGLSINTARRDTAPDADLARGTDNGFVRFAQALSDAKRAARVVQLHGFAASTAQRLRLAEDTLVIGGPDKDRARQSAVVRCLRDAGFTARKADASTRSLAGRSNPVGRALHARAPGIFLHVELGPAIRDRLLSDADARTRFMRCL